MYDTTVRRMMSNEFAAEKKGIKWKDFVHRLHLCIKYAWLRLESDG